MMKKILLILISLTILISCTELEDDNQKDQKNYPEQLGTGF